ncbi:MAG: ATP-binding cassette domain-containing protein [Actinomycetota bacterium]|nr:ATP-binding cassette domain-containing protein [Actinomycetota bacterium]
MTGSAVPTLQVTGATMSLGGRIIWRDIGAEVGAGELVAVLGPNGVGKSTLIKAVLGLLPLTSGQIRVLGRAPGESRRQIGYLPQRRSFDPGLRVRGSDVVRLGVEGARWGMPLPGGRWISEHRRAEQRRIDEVIDRVGASTYAHRPIGQLSGGEQQRLLIAQALVQKPLLLLLDEPLDSLDLPNQAAVAALISAISREEGVAVVIVAHDVNPIIGYLDRVIYLGPSGTVAGPVSEVITTEQLTRLYGTPIEVLQTSDGRLVVVGQPDARAVHADHGHAS